MAVFIERNMGKVKKNFKSDFSFYLDLYDRDGKNIGFPECDFCFTVKSEWGGRVYRGFRRGDLMQGCSRHDERLLIVCDGHGLPPGNVSVEVCLHVPNPVYADGFEDVVKQCVTDIELTEGDGCEGCPGTAEMTLPIVGMKPECPCVVATAEEIAGIAEKALAD